jgi:hypothetical protein
MRFTNFFLTLCTSSSLALADVSFTAPAAGALVRGGSPFEITWTDSGEAPALADLTSYQLLLYSGSNANPV